MMQVKRNTEKEVNENGKNKSLNCACISCSKDFLGDMVKTSSEVKWDKTSELQHNDDTTNLNKELINSKLTKADLCGI